MSTTQGPGGAGVLDAALEMLPAILGARVRAQREKVEQSGLPSGLVPVVMTQIGFPMTAEDLARLEAGDPPFPIDARLMLALTFVLEFSTDAAVVECLHRASGGTGEIPDS